MKEEHLLDIALELSDKLFESEPTHGLMVQGSNMIRKLVAELDETQYNLKSLAKRYTALDKTKPLSDEEINKLLIPITNINIWDKPNELVKLARAIEERHGIK